MTNAQTRRRPTRLLWGVAGIAAGVAVGCGGSSGDSGTDTARGTFTQVGSLATGRVSHAATLISPSGLVLVVGGKGRSGSSEVVLDSAEIFDPTTGSFAPAAGTLAGGGKVGASGRMAHSAVALPTGRVLVVGGQTDTVGQAGLDTCELFAGASEKFLPVLGNLSEPKSEVLAIPYVAGGTTFVMIAGGRRADPQSPAAGQVSVRTADLYRAQDNRVEPAPSGAQLITGRFGARATLLLSGEYVVQGGVERPSENAIPTPAGFEVFSFDPATGVGVFAQSSQELPGDGNAALNVDRFATDAAILGENAAVFGGSDDATDPSRALDTIEFYDPTSNSWTVVAARLATPRHGHTATRLANGDVLVVGGRSATLPALGTTEIVSGSGVNATVAKGPALRTARRNHTATLLSNGQILIVGGEDAAGVPLAAAEIFALPGSSVAGGGGGGVTPGGPDAPSGLSLNPNSGPVGSQVTISNTSNNFSLTLNQNIVRFNGIVTPVRSGTASDLTVTIPNGATTGEVSVQIGKSVSTMNPTFTVSTGTGGGGTGGG